MANTDNIKLLRVVDESSVVEHCESPPRASLDEEAIKSDSRLLQKDNSVTVPEKCNNDSSTNLFRYQQQCLIKIDNFRQSRKRNKNGYIEMPTASGKTLVAVHSVRLTCRTNERVLWIVHSLYLLEQAEREFVRVYGPEILEDIGYLTGNQKVINRRITLATIQTLSGGNQKELHRYIKQGMPTFVIYDEYHHAVAKSWIIAIDILSDNKVCILGMSATATRTDPRKRELLEHCFPHCVFRVGMTELINDGVLARPQVYRVEVRGPRVSWEPSDLEHFGRFKEVPQKILNNLSAQIERNQAIIETYVERGRSYRTLVFCCSIEHARSLADLFLSRGIAAAAVTGSAANPSNISALERFESGDLTVLTSVLLLTEGVDLPSCNTIYLARPTQSEILIKQMIGRGLRGPKVGGTEECVIIDFVDTFENFKDVSGTSVGFMREYDPRIRSVLERSPMDGDDTGLDMATLLRVRDWMGKRYATDIAVNPIEVFLHDISNVVQFFDDQAGISRALLIPFTKKERFIKSIEDAKKKFLNTKSGLGDDLSVAAMVRNIYAKRFKDDPEISEEDFVTIISKGIKTDDGIMVTNPESALSNLSTSSLGEESVVQEIVRETPGLDLLIKKLK